MALSKSNQLINEDVIVKRIKVIRGHLAGVENMLISQKPHQDILTQLSAIRSALHKVTILESQRYIKSAMNTSYEQANDGNTVNDAIKRLMAVSYTHLRAHE